MGAGPWDAELLTLAGLRRLQRAEVVLADYLANPNLLLHAPPDAEIVQRERGAGGGPRLRQPELNEMMVQYALAGRYVVRLKGGDPCMFGRGGEEAQVLRAAGIDFEFVPGVSSPIAAPQAAGIPVTHRDHTPAVTFVSGYEAYEKAGLHVEWEHLARSAGTIVLMMSVKNARENAQRLVAAGRDPATPAAVIRWGTRGIQRTVVGRLDDIADRIEAAGIRAPSVLVVGHVVSLRDELAWFERRPLFGRRVVVTRTPEASDALTQGLAAQGADVAWFPCLRIVPPTDPAGSRAAIVDALRARTLDGILLTSVHGVRACFDALAEASLDVRSLAGIRVAVVGSATEAACRGRGIVPDLVADPQTSEGLAQTLSAAQLLRQRWLHVSADEVRSVLRTEVEAAGGSYRQVVGYRATRPAVPETLVRSLLPPEEGGEGFDAIGFASGKTVRHFLESVDAWLEPGTGMRLLQRSRIVSIGPVTTAALRGLGLEVAAEARTPDDEALALAFAEALTP